MQWTILKRLSFVDVCLQDPLGVGDEAAVGTEQRFCRAMMIGDDMFPQRTLLATHHLQTLTTKKCNVWTWTRDLISECLFGQELLWSRQRVVDFFLPEHSKWGTCRRGRRRSVEWVPSSLLPLDRLGRRQRHQDRSCSHGAALGSYHAPETKWRFDKVTKFEIAWRVAHLLFDKLSQR